MVRMIGVIYPQTLVPHNKDRYPCLLREVDAVPCASGSSTLWVIGECEAEIGSQLNHLLVADGASSSAVLLPVGSIDLSLEIEQALSIESSVGVCACCATVYESGALLGLVDNVLYSDEQCVRVIRCPLVGTGTSDEQAGANVLSQTWGYSKQKERGGGISTILGTR